MSAIAKATRINTTLRERLEDGLVVLILMLSTSAGFAVWISSADNAVLDSQGDIRGQVLWACLYLVVFWRSARYFGRFPDALRACCWAVALVFLAVASVLWSDDPGFTVHRVTALLGTTLFGVYFALRYTLLQQIRLIAIALTVAGILSVIAVITIPSFAIQPEYNDAWRGVFVYKNAAGTFMALGVAVQLVLAFADSSRRSRWIVAAVFSSILVVKSHSATAVVMLIAFCLVVLLAPVFRVRWKLAAAAVLTSLPFAIGGVAWGASHFDELTETFGRTSTLTGRTPLWQFVMEQIAQRPILGHGYDGFWAANGREVTVAIAGWASPHAHNGFLELLLNVGVAGLILFLVSLAVLFRRSLRTARQEANPYRLWPLLFLTWLLIYNITLPGILERNSLGWILFIALSCSLHPAGQQTVSAVCTDPDSAGYSLG